MTPARKILIDPRARAAPAAMWLMLQQPEAGDYVVATGVSLNQSK